MNDAIIFEKNEYEEEESIVKNNHTDIKESVTYKEAAANNTALTALRCQFHQHFMRSFYAGRFQKHQNAVKLTVFLRF